MNTTPIEWCRTYHPDGTWTPGYSSNPIRARALDPRTGRMKTYHHCVKQGPECTNCYAESLNLRWGTGRTYTADNDKLIEWVLDRREFAAWQKAPAGSRIFVEDMSDFAHRTIPDAFLDEIGEQVARNRHVVFLFLTKRAQRGAAIMRRWVARYGPLPHVQFGVSCGTQQATWRLDYLRDVTGVGARFVSYEPALERVDFGEALAWVDWLICGGESGPRHRPFNPDWARDALRQCQQFGTAFFFKQHGGRTPKAGGRLLDGRTWDEYPALQVAA